MRLVATCLIAVFALFCCQRGLYAEAALPLIGRFVQVDRHVLEKRDLSLTSKALARYITGLIYDNHGNTREAVAEYREALRFLPGQPSVLTRLGAGLLLEGDPAQALVTFEEAISACPEQLEPYLLAAIVHASGRDYQNAEQMFNRALKYFPDNVKVLTMLADVLILQEDLQGAVEVYERLVRIEKKPLAYFNLGVLYTRLQDLSEAVQSLEKAVELDEGYLEAQNMLGHVYQIEGKYTKAIEQYKQVLRIDPLYIEAYGRLSQIYHQLGMHEEALEQNRTIMKVAPSDPQSYLRAFSIFLSQNEHEEARDVLSLAVERGLDNPAIYASLGYLAALEEDLDRTERYYRKAISLAGDGGDVWRYYLASVFYQAGREQEAQRELEDFISDDFEDVMPQALNLLGYIYAEWGENLDRAVELIEGALRADPENGAYLDSLGWAYYKKGELDKALEYIGRAAELEPTEPVIMEHYAIVLEEKGRLTEALEKWEKALKFDEENEEYMRRMDALKKELGL